jgi:hypothetical protein
MTNSNNNSDAENVYYDLIEETGYVKITDGDVILYAHQLEALKENSGYEVFDDSNQCHHRNKNRWDNRDENVDVMSNHHHNLIHNRGEWTEDDGEPIWDIVSTDVTAFSSSD